MFRTISILFGLLLCLSCSNLVFHSESEYFAKYDKPRYDVINGETVNGVESVYIAGLLPVDTEHDSVALWKNGNLIYHDKDTRQSMWVTSVQVVNSEVFVSYGINEIQGLLSGKNNFISSVMEYDFQVNKNSYVNGLNNRSYDMIDNTPIYAGGIKPYETGSQAAVAWLGTKLIRLPKSDPSEVSHGQALSTDGNIIAVVGFVNHQAHLWVIKNPRDIISENAEPDIDEISLNGIGYIHDTYPAERSYALWSFIDVNGDIHVKLGGDSSNFSWKDSVVKLDGTNYNLKGQFDGGWRDGFYNRNKKIAFILSYDESHADGVYGHYYNPENCTSYGGLNLISDMKGLSSYSYDENSDTLYILGKDKSSGRNAYWTVKNIASTPSGIKTVNKSILD